MIYYVMEHGKPTGPVDGTVLRQRLIASGQPNPQLQVNVMGSDEWRPVSQFPEFADLFPPTAARAPAYAPAYAPPTRRGGRDKTAALLLAFFLGGLGAHKFYLGQIVWGVVYLVFCWTFIPSIAAFIEFFILLAMRPQDFDRRFNS